MEQFAKAEKPAHCFFEWIYFANVASTLDDRSVYLSRTRLGEELARCERAYGRVPLDDPDTIIVPVPELTVVSARRNKHLTSLELDRSTVSTS